MREIKFRVWDGIGHMSKPFTLNDLQSNTIQFTTNCVVMQFTGKTCHNKKEVYEGDILFYEESEEDGDKRYYLVVTWIHEWCMFATLHIEEYLNYLKEGKEALDEVLFWTYPIEESEDYHYTGTIYENTELLNQ